MYEVILPKEEFLLKDVTMQKTLLAKWRDNYSNEQIKKEMKINNYDFYELVAKLEIPKKIKRKTKEKIVDVNTHYPTKKKIELSIDNPIPSSPQEYTIGLQLHYNGTFSADQVSKMFEKLNLIIDGEQTQYEVNISIKEKA